MKKNRIIVCCEYNELVDSIISQILERKSDLELLGIVSINGLPNNEKKTKSLFLGYKHDIIENNNPDVDLILLVGYPLILPESIINKYKCINSHASLLPQYRGFHSTGWALINNEQYVGYTIHIAETTFDTGSILYQHKIKTSNMTTFGIIKDSIIDDMKKRFVPVIIDYLNNKIKPQTQSIDTLPKISSKRSISDCLINWEQKTSFIERFIRALLPPQAPGAFTIFKNKKLIITKANVYNCAPYYGTPGKVLLISGKKILIKTQDTALWVDRVIYDQIEQDASDVINNIGHFLGIDLKSLKLKELDIT